MLAQKQGCDSLQPEIWRRWAYLKIYRHQYREARITAQRALRGFLRLGDTHGAGRALLARGYAREQAGDFVGAHKDASEALTLIPRWDDFFYAAALQNLTAFLASPRSTHQQLENALGRIAEARESIRHHAGYRVLRIRLRWVELLILHRLERMPVYRVRQGLERVFKVLSELGMPQDAAAAAADMAAISARHCRSEAQLESLVGEICERLDALVGIPLRPLVQKLRLAAQAIDPRTAINEAATALRGSVRGHGVPAALN